MNYKELHVQEFFETQYRQYSNYDNERSIPNLLDGLKITTRKIIYTCIKNNITKEFKVAQLASSVAFETAYHHGEAGIGSVICNLAQNFVGSNNFNYLEPEGQFGSRLSPTPAAHRYIFTYLSKNFRTFFKKDDELILEQLYDDDQLIEPKYYIPIIPGILINSTQGIGTGFASLTLARNPKEVVEYINNKLSNKPTELPLLPYFKGFKGTVEHIEQNKYRITGCISRINTTTIKITEIPVGMYLNDIKKHLNKLSDLNVIKDFDDNSTEEGFDIDVYFSRTTLNELSDEQLLEKLKLTTTITENLTCWLPTDKLRKFNSVPDIIDYFIEFRLLKYTERIDKLISIISDDINILSEKIRFIYFYLSNSELFKNSSKLQITAIMDENLFDNDMLNMRIYNLTKDKIQELEKELAKLQTEKKKLEKTTNKQLYKKELLELQEVS
jgi:DNA topoisomerase-2